MFAFDLDADDSLYGEGPHSWFCDLKFKIRDDGKWAWVLEKWNLREGVRVPGGMYNHIFEACRAYNRAVDEIVKEMKAVFGRAFFGKHDGCISSFQVLLVLENLDGIVSWERVGRLFGIDEAAKTFKQIYGDAHLAAVTQRIRNPGTYPSWKDYVDYEAAEQIYELARYRAQFRRVLFPWTNPSWKDYVDYEDYEAYKKIFEEVDEKSWTVHTRAHMDDRAHGAFVGGKRPEDTRRLYTGPQDTRTALFTTQIYFGFSYHRYPSGPESDHDTGIGNMPGLAKIISEDRVRCTLLRDLALQPLLAKTYAILFPNLINANLPVCKRWKDVLSATIRTVQNVLKKVRSKKSGGPSNGLISLFKSASKLAVGMLVIGNTPAVGALRTMAPEAVEPGSVQADDFEKSSNFAFGVVACVGTLVAIIALVKSVNCKRRHSLAGSSSTASAPTGAIANRAANMPQTLTILRSWRETEYREVVVARREEVLGAYAS